MPIGVPVPEGTDKESFAQAIMGLASPMAMGTFRVPWSPRAQKKLLEELVGRGMEPSEATKAMFEFSQKVNAGKHKWYQFDPSSIYQFFKKSK